MIKRQTAARLTLISALLVLCGCSSLPPGGALAVKSGPVQSDPQAQQPIRAAFAAQDTAVQADGRVVVFGLSGAEYVFSRYLTSGQPDPSFGAAGEVRLPRTVQGSLPEVLRLTVQADGKLLALGGHALLRLLPDGQPDPAFGQDGRVTAGLPAAPQAFSALPDGRVLVAGGSRDLAADPAAPASSVVLARLLPDGQPDPTFGAGGQVALSVDDSASAYSLWPLADGGALVGGTALSLKGGTYSRWVVTRFGASGVPDPTFGEQGVATVRQDRFAATRPSSLAVDVLGRVLTAGYLSSGVCTLARLLPTGKSDPAWAYENTSALRVLPDGSAPGSGGAADRGPGVSLALLPGNRAVLGGCAQFVPDASGQEQAQPGLARLGADGSPDPTFGSEGFQTVPDSAQIGTTPQGKLLAGLDPVTEIEP
ncbi:delta-60 repeat domain-containing protein [Deinococcus frigens]|uniref:delta-60 repeat domain-containing protein n=1 Tax=Deinococcus frigens TaxID=249403 RepID=UPI00054EE384|nr:delta-60 repeat domain-containing protein [Deinococcus frigens]